MEVIGLPNAKGLLLVRAKSHETPYDFKRNGLGICGAYSAPMNSTFPLTLRAHIHRLAVRRKTSDCRVVAPSVGRFNRTGRGKNMPVVSKGLEGIAVAQTRIGDVRGDVGQLIYYGYDINELAGKVCFEEVIHLLWEGRLPNRKELEQLGDELIA